MKSKSEVLKEQIFKIALMLMILSPILIIGILELSSGSMFADMDLLAGSNSSNTGGSGVLIGGITGGNSIGGNSVGGNTVGDSNIYKGDLELKLEDVIDEGKLYGNWNNIAGIKSFLKTSDKLYIRSIVQLKVFADYVNAGNNCFDIEVILLNNINGNALTWNPIGTSDNPFKGKFNGNGYYISNITIEAKNAPEDFQNLGLFGVNEGEVINLKTLNFKYEFPDAKVMANIGNIVAINYGDITNCVNTSAITYSGSNYNDLYFGGIAGCNRGKITNCRNEGKISSTSYYVGGITGYTEGGKGIYNCYNSGEIIGYKYVGGIVGEAIGIGNLDITDCVNAGYVSGRNYVGGIVGNAELTTISKCTNKGNVTDSNTSAYDATVGGIIGQAKYCTISRCLLLHMTLTTETAKPAADSDKPNIRICGNKDTTTITDYGWVGVTHNKTEMKDTHRISSPSNTECNYTVGINYLGTTLKETDTADFTRPEIYVYEPVRNLVTNKETIDYIIYASQEVSGFDTNDIIVSKGRVDQKKSIGGRYTYIDITTTIQSGQKGLMTVAIPAASGCNSKGLYNEYKALKSQHTIGIDRKGPTINITANKSEILINEGVQFKVTSSEYAIIKYKWDNGNGRWHNANTGGFSTSISDSLTESGMRTLTVKAIDQLGNESEKTYQIRVNPFNAEVSGNPTNWTTGPVDFTVKCDKGITIKDISVRLNNSEEIEINKQTNTFTVSKNGTYIITIIDSFGNEAAFREVVTFIDTDKPKINSYDFEGNNIIITASDGKGSGVEKYAITTTATVPSAGDWQTSNKIEVPGDGIYYVWVKDKVGNVSNSMQISLNNVSIPINIDGQNAGIIKFYHKVSGEDEYVEITDINDKYLKHDETLRAEIEINEYIFAGLNEGKAVKLSDVLDKNGKVIEQIAKNIYPALTIGEYYFTPVSAIQTEDEKLTKLVYEFTNNDEEQEEVLNPIIKLDLTKNNEGKTIYMYSSEDYLNFYTGDYIDINASGTIKINIDGIPYLITEAYVEDKKATGKYIEGTPIIIEVSSSEKLKEAEIPEVNVSFSTSGLGKYNHQSDSTKGNAKLENTKTDDNGYTVWTYSYIIQSGDEGIVNVKVTGKITDYADNTEEIETELEERKVYADTNGPTAEIKPLVDGNEIINSITNAEKITYVITFNEEVTGFVTEDIIVNGGAKGELSKVTKNSDGTYSYTIEITTDVKPGNYGILQVILEQGVCTDLSGFNNIRRENEIIIDRRAPQLIDIEILADKKEAYKQDDKFKIIAVFSENITNTPIVPELELTFAETGLAKGELTQGIKAGNTITWEYTIAGEDLGKLVIKKLMGTIVDLAGNETVINKKNLENYGIIADTIAPKGTITFDKNEMTKEDVTATITFDEEVIILNNEGKNTYTFTENGEFTFEFEDLAGNVSTETAVVTIIDKQAPVANIDYTINKNGTVTVTITFDEEAIITNNGGKNTHTFTKNGEFTFEFKDLVGNEGSKVVIVDSMSETDTPEVPDEPDTPKVEGKIEFKDLVTKEENGIKYVKVNAGMSVEEIIAKMDSTKLEGQKPTVTNLSKDGLLKTGSEIKLNGETKYTVVVKGDVNCDGKVEFISDIIKANNYRIGIVNLNAMQKLAADINNNGKIEFLADIIAMNNYKLGILKSL